MKKDNLIGIMIGQALGFIVALGVTLNGAVNDDPQGFVLGCFVCFQSLVVWALILKYEGGTIAQMLTDLSKKEDTNQKG
ncbi:MAG: hypothetical protein KAJ19_19455 [Gammaproteobacteria bacterium]|nr:hypothetical protein [Gammaproteobacteria bacterium]